MSRVYRRRHEEGLEQHGRTGRSTADRTAVRTELETARTYGKDITRIEACTDRGGAYVNAQCCWVVVHSKGNGDPFCIYSHGHSLAHPVQGGMKYKALSRVTRLSWVRYVRTSSEISFHFLLHPSTLSHCAALHRTALHSITLYKSVIGGRWYIAISNA